MVANRSRVGASLGRRLTGLALISTLPLFAFSLSVALDSYQRERELAERRTLAAADAIAVSVERQIQVETAGLRGLALSDALRHGDFTAFAVTATAYLQQANPGASLVVTQRDGTILFAIGPSASGFSATGPSVTGPPVTGPPVTSRHGGEGEGRRSAIDVVERVFATGEPTTSDFYRDTVSGQGSFSFDVPVKDNAGKVLYDLALNPHTGALTELLTHQRGPSWIATLVDRNGAIIARSPPLETYLGRIVTPSLRALLTGPPGDQGISHSFTQDGTFVVTAYVRLANSWSVAVGLPETEISGFARHAAQTTLLTGGAFIAIALLLARLLARQIARPIDQLRTIAADPLLGQRPPMPTGLPEADDVSAALRDVAARRDQAVAVAAANARKLQGLVDAAAQVFWTADPAGVFEPSATWRAFTGQSEDAEIEQWSAAIHPDDRQAAIAAWQHSLATGQAYETDYRVWHASSQTWRYMNVRGIPVRSPSGGAEGWVGMNIDIQDRRTAEQSLRELTRTLERRVADEVAAREEAQRRAARSERMQALGQLAGGVAHDFNNILQAIESGASLLERRADDAASVRRLTAMLLGATERGASVARRLLSFSRQDSLQAEAIDVGALLGNLREVLGHTLGGAFTCQLDLPPESLPAVLADKGQLESALVNLAANARDATPGGGAITLSARAAMLGTTDAVCIALTDHGQGMDTATLARATEPFFTTKAAGRGTGLGLSTVRSFAERSSGTLRIRSTPGTGTEVAITLPLAAPAATLAPASTAQHAEPPPLLPHQPVNARRGAQLLVVDDDPLVRAVLVEQLQAAGHRVVVMDGGAEALIWLRGGGVAEAVVTDFSMPGMDGLAVIEAARLLRPALPAILLTGYADENARLAATSGVHAFALLHKPVTAARLLAAIDHLLPPQSSASALADC